MTRECIYAISTIEFFDNFVRKQGNMANKVQINGSMGQNQTSQRGHHFTTKSKKHQNLLSSGCHILHIKTAFL